MRTITKDRSRQLCELENRIGYTFEKKNTLNRALTHSSYANQHGLPYVEHNERLEFLGDSVLSLVISQYIFKKYRSKPEGKLTKIRASIVCEASLYERAKELGLGEFLLMGKGEELTGGRERASILADAYEALIAAIYVDGDMENSSKFVISQFAATFEDSIKGKQFKDYKSMLQEYIQKDQGVSIKYEVIGEEGPDHDRMFHVSANVDSGYSGLGHGKSKKAAEQAAAKSVLRQMGVIK